MSLAKYNYIRSKAITQSARGETCSMQSPACNGNSETVVWCHSNAQVHGKGKGIKASDLFGFYGCSGCHRWFDSYDAEPETLCFFFTKAHAESLCRLIDKKILSVKP